MRLASLAAEAQAILAPRVSEYGPGHRLDRVIVHRAGCVGVGRSRAIPRARGPGVSLANPGLAPAGHGIRRVGLVHRAGGRRIQAHPAKRALPGGIIAERTDGQLILSRHDACASKPS